MIPQIVTVGPLVIADDDNISVSQSAAGAQALTITGDTATAGVATLDTARRVIITSAADDSLITFRVTGTNLTGNPIRESVTGAAIGIASTLQDFLTVSEIFTSAATAGNVKVGTNGVASSPWEFINYHMGPVSLSFGVIVSGTANYTVQYCYDNPNSNQNTLGGGLYPAVPNTFDHPSLQSLSIKADGALNVPIFAWRLTINSQTHPGSVTATAIQAGIQNAAWG